MDRKLNRRAMLRNMAMGSLTASFALEQLAGVPLLGTWASDWLVNPLNAINRLDAFEMMASAARGGPAMLAVHQAMAADAEGWVLVQIKVCNHVFTPLCFKLGKLTDGVVTTAPDVPLASRRTTTANAMLVGQGVDEISEKPRYQALRFNRWFANILHYGTADGQAPSSGNLLGLSSSDVAPLSEDKVAVQAFLGLRQIESNNHALKGCKMRTNLPDVTLFAARNELVQSPLGITCFMMGGQYDRAEGATPVNAVLGESPSEAAIVTSRAVGAYVAQVTQYVGNSYADRASIEQNVIYRMDKLVDQDPVLRRDLINSIAQFQAGLSNLRECADLETNRQVFDASKANGQTVNRVQTGASTEFLAQCKYVANSVDLPGMPVRNFSLFLNASDLDQVDYDKATDGGAGAAVEAYSYVEAMRQLGMGLNLLANKIAQGKKIVVLVSSEGGRGANMEDSTVSFAMVMGPKGAGMLTDALYANMNGINAEDNAFIRDPAFKDAIMPWDVAGLTESDGTASPADTIPTTGDVQMGIVEFLDAQAGKNSRKNLPSADARFVRLKRA